MSLQALATNMASQGRGPDSMLVHMAPREVAGLQSLAMAHGGSLTINPTTGLPEAGFLSNLLPTLIGAGLSIASGGALTPLMAAGITGAGYGIASGSLSKGLMAGLGAYGGAGLGSGLSAAGAAQASVPGAAPVAAEATSAFATDPAAYTRFEATPTNLSAFGGTPAVAEQVANPWQLTDLPTPEAAAPAPTTPLAAATPAPAPTYSPAYGTETAKNAFQSQAADATMTDNFKQAGRGLTSLFDSEAGRNAFLGQAGKEGVEATGVGGLGGLAKYGAAAMAGPLLTPPAGTPYKPDTEQHRYSYDPNRNPDPQGSYTGAPTGERQWFAPKYTRLYADGGQTQSSDDAQKYLMNTDQAGKTNDLAGASRQAYDYLMGNGPGYRPPVFTKSSLPAAYNPGQDVEGGITNLLVPEPTTSIPVIDTEPKYTADPYIFQPEPDPYEAEIDTDPEPEPEPEPVDTYVDDPSITARDAYVPPMDTYEDDSYITARDAYVPPMDVYQPQMDDSYITARDAYVPPMDAYTPPETNQYIDARDAAAPPMDIYQPAVQETPDATLAESANATDIDNATIAVDNQPTVQETTDGGAVVTTRESPVQETTDGGVTVTMPDYIAPDDTVIQQQPAVQDNIDGSATVTLPADNISNQENTQTAINPDNENFVEVGDAGGDYGDFGGGGGGVTNVGMGGGEFGGGNYMDMFDDQAFAHGGMLPQYATGGISNLGSYSDGGRLLKGPGDGVSDSIPAMIGKKQPARLADGEFVIPARIVSELGNGSTDAGARKLYQMMDRIQAARKKTTGKNRVAVNSRTDKMMPV